MSKQVSQAWIDKALGHALDRIASGEPHKHHAVCKHNLSAERQKELDGFTDREREAYGLGEPLVITPADWEIEAPDFGPIVEEG
jgi:hypothetical protein